MATLQPILRVADVDASIAFYRDALGFTVHLTVRDRCGRAVHAELSRNGAGLMLDLAGDLSAAARLVLGAGVALYLTDDSDDLDALYERARRHGADVLEEIGDRDWGDRTFSIRDPDGYVLTFAATIRPRDCVGARV